MSVREAEVAAASGMLAGLLFCFGFAWVVNRQLVRAERINQ